MSAPDDCARSFVAELAAPSFHNVFNPYSDACAEHDLQNAPAIRRRNLEAVLSKAMHLGTRSIWIGLELGRGGGRRTGLAMTDDAHLLHHAKKFEAQGIKHATKSGPMRELTAGVVWTALDQIREPVFLWNVFPLHPHKPGLSLSNRRHNREELLKCRSLLGEMFSMLSPEMTVAIGADAQNALASQNYKFWPVRHPAYGGKSAFLREIKDIYQL